MVYTYNMNYKLNNIKIDKNSPQKLLQSRFLLYCVIGLLLLKIFTIAVYINFPSNIFFADITKSTLMSFVNQSRQSSGLQPLVESKKLDQAAQLKAEDMVQKQYFSHTSPQGVSPWYWFKTIGYNYKYAGENLAIGFFDSKEVYEAWLNSPSHKANLLNSNYKEIGTAVLGGFGSNNAVVVVQLFGSQQPVKTPVISKNNNTTNVNNNVEQPKVNIEPESKNTATTGNVGEKVLSQSTESLVITEGQASGSNNLYSRFLNFMLYSYNAVLQDFIFGFLLIVIGALLFAIFFNSTIINKKQFVFRSLIIVALLSFGALLSKDVIIFIIPHQVII